MRDRKIVERPSKQREKEARSHKEREKAAHVAEKREKLVKNEKPRYQRAGATDTRRNTDRYVSRRGDTRFTEIWNDRR